MDKAKASISPQDGETQTPARGRARAQWHPGTPAGGKGAYGLEDERSEGYSGYKLS